MFNLSGPFFLLFSFALVSLTLRWLWFSLVYCLFGGGGTLFFLDSMVPSVSSFYFLYSVWFLGPME